MKTKLKFFLAYGAASAAFTWSLQELFLYLFTQLSLPSALTVTFFGALTGAIVCGLFGGLEGFFLGSRYLFRKGLKTGLPVGFLGGGICFFLIHEIVQQSVLPSTSPLVITAVYSLRWASIALFVGLTLGLRDRNQLSILRGLSSAIVTGMAGGALITAVTTAQFSPFISRGISITVLALLLSTTLFMFSNLGRKAWLKVLNGKLEGLDIELSKEIHIFGTQDNDDINLQDYPDVQQAHAKLIRYFDNYSLIDNDPFSLTFVNFRGIKEQFLKNGDILKIGTALFQYCTAEP